MAFPSMETEGKVKATLPIFRGGKPATLPFALADALRCAARNADFGCTPEPLIMTVFGAMEEPTILPISQPDVFDFKWTNPNTGKEITTAGYPTTLVGAEQGSYSIQLNEP